MFCGMRTPKTLNEMKQTSVMMHDEDILIAGIRIRAKRQPNNLPNAWDDKPVHSDRCWKSQRKTHYILS